MVIRNEGRKLQSQVGKSSLGWYEKIYALCPNTGIKIPRKKIWWSLKIDTTDDVIFLKFFRMTDEKKMLKL